MRRSRDKLSLAARFGSCHGTTLHRRGIFLLDSVVAMGLIVAVAGLLVVGRQAAAKAMRVGEDRRAATRLAETYLNGPTNVMAATDGVTATPLPDVAPRGWRWTAVRATVGKQTAELVGLVREGR